MENNDLDSIGSLVAILKGFEIKITVNGPNIKIKVNKSIPLMATIS